MNAAATAYADQLQAATKEAHRVTRQIAALLDDPVSTGAPPVALVAVIARHVLTVMAGEGLSCPHVDPARPAPRYAVAWMPGRETCGPCTWQLDARPEDNHRCDQCGTSVPGKLSLAVFRLGPWVITGGFCGVCFPGGAT